jgi:dihydrofolate reductase
MIEMIVAMGLNREIGKDNKLLWNLEDDMKHFVKTTKGKNVVMGRKTFESLPNGPLKGRHNYVITRGSKHGIIVNENTNVNFLSYEDFLALNLQDFI